MAIDQGIGAPVPGPSGDDGDRPGGFFEAAYAAGRPPWDIGRPQPEMVALEEAGTFGPRVLDAGCGTGETSLYLAARGHDVVGIDASSTAIERASAKGAERGIDVEFVVGDVLEMLPGLEARFDVVVDVGFFHTLSDSQRVRFAFGLAEAVASGGVYAMLCFSDRVPDTGFGPRRVSETEIRATFGGPAFRIRAVRPAQLGTATEGRPPIDANLALVERA